jgi:hypothetical protein
MSVRADLDVLPFFPSSDGQANVPSDALARPKCELDQLRSTIHNLSTRATALSAIEKEIDAARAHITSLLMHRNNLTPVFLLPPELLARIFHFHSLAEPPWHGVNRLGWITDTHVCRHWRQVAMDHASLWARISGFPMSTKWITEQLSRAKSSPLVIELLGSPTLETISFFPPHFPHTRELRLRGLRKDHFAVIKELCALEAPDLEHFELGVTVESPLTSQNFVGASLFHGNAPKLRTLALCQVRVPWSFFPRCQFTQLKIVLCEEEWNEAPSLESLEQLMDVLLNCPNLEVLVLEYCLPSMLSQYMNKRTVPLPRLSQLTLTGSISRVVRFFEALNMPSSTKLNLHCVVENCFGNQAGLLIPLVYSHFNRSSLVNFRSFKAAINHLERSLEIVASTTAPVSTVSPSSVFDSDPEGDSPELSLSFIAHSEFGQFENILERACGILPITEVQFLSVSAPDSFHALNWGELFRKCAKVTTIEASGHGTTTLLQTITPPKAPPKPSNNNNYKGKKKGRGKKKEVPPQPVDNAPVCAPVFPKLTSLLLKKFDFSESVPHVGTVYNVLNTLIQRRKNRKVPLKMLSIERSILCQQHATTLEKLVREFHWSGEDAMSFDEYDFDEFDHYSSDYHGGDYHGADYHGARWEDFFVGTSQAEWEWWENYSDGY